MSRARLNAIALAAQILGTICLLLDSIRTAVRLPKEGVMLGDAGFVSSLVFQWASVVGYGFLFTGFALQAFVLWRDRSQAPPEADAMPAPQRKDTSITPNVGELVMVSDAPTVRISPLFEALLNSAGQLLKDAHHSAAVLIAQTAIEVCTERIVGKFIAARGATFLSKWIDDRLDNYNIFSETVRRLYQAVSTDSALVSQDFWTSNRLKNHVELRNDIAHEGRQASPTEAQASVQVAREVIQYLSGVTALRGFDLGEK